MGSSRWGDSDRGSYRSYAVKAQTESVRETFKQRQIHRDLDPSRVVIRESVDSDANPTSNPIIIALDVTGSMGMIAHTMAKEGLGTLIESVLDRKPVVDPHIMFMAVGDVYSDEAPLQVSQFEADIRIVQQLSQIYVEGHGGGNNTESYDLPWYFAANKTKVDAFDKRGKKGYLFTIGDELPPAGLTPTDLTNVFGHGQYTRHTADELLRDAEEKFNVFHIIVEQGNYARRDVAGVTRQWRELMGRHAVLLSDYSRIAEVIVSVIEVNEGRDPESVITSWQSGKIADAVKHALYD